MLVRRWGSWFRRLLHLRHRGRQWFAICLAVVAGAHVVLVWQRSFAWSITDAAVHAPLPWQARLTWLAWPIVTLGRVGCGWPVMLASGLTVVAAVWQVVRSRRRSQEMFDSPTNAT